MLGIADDGLPGHPGRAVGVVIHHYAQAAKRPGGAPYAEAYGQLVRIMVLLLFAGMLQMGVWALLYRMLGQFEDYETALYFSGVTFTSLGYGDLTLPKRVRILSAMEAADGLMMFGVISAGIHECLAAFRRAGAGLVQGARAGKLIRRVRAPAPAPGRRPRTG
jgi:hypothetical protein